MHMERYFVYNTEPHGDQLPEVFCIEREKKRTNLQTSQNIKCNQEILFERWGTSWAGHQFSACLCTTCDSLITITYCYCWQIDAVYRDKVLCTVYRKLIPFGFISVRCTVDYFPILECSECCVLFFT